MGFPIGTRYQAPNVKSVAQQTVEELLFSMTPPPFKKGVTLASGYPHVRVGDVLGIITATGKYRRYTKVLAAQTRVTGDSTLTLKDSLGNAVPPPFKVGEVIDIGAQGSKTVTAVDEVNSKITIATTMGGSISVNDAVILHTDDGSGTAACIAARPVFGPFWNPETGEGATLDVDYELDAIFAGILRKSVIKGYGTGVVTDLDIKDLGAFLDAVIVR